MEPAQRVTLWVGLGLISLGAFLPWTMQHPLAAVEILAYPAGLGSGLELWGLLTLPLAGIAFCGTLIDVRWISTRTFRAAVGVVAIGFAVLSLVDTPGLTGVFIAGSGVFVTLAGGVLVILTQRHPVVTGSSRLADSTTSR